MFYSEFDHLLPESFRQVDLYPKKLRNLIDEANEWIYNDINNGVYKSGFATWGSGILSRRLIFPLILTKSQNTRSLWECSQALVHCPRPRRSSSSWTNISVLFWRPSNRSGHTPVYNYCSFRSGLRSAFQVQYPRHSLWVSELA